MSDVTYQLKEQLEIEILSNVFISHIRFTTNGASKVFHFLSSDDICEMADEAILTHRVDAARQGHKLQSGEQVL